MKAKQVKELLLQALETEIGGIEVYKTALRCAVNSELRREWEEYLVQTERHVDVLREVCSGFGIVHDEESPGRRIVRHIGQSLVDAMKMALQAGDKNAAQLVATECVVLAETKDLHNWELLGEVARNLTKKLAGEEGKVLREAHAEVEEHEDKHYYHTVGWSRELWIEALGMQAVLPPPEEEKDVKTAIGAARAKKARKEML